MQQDAQRDQNFFIYRGKDLLRAKLSLAAFLSPKSSRVSIDDILRSKEDHESPSYQHTLSPTSSTPILHKTNLSGGCSLLTTSSSSPPSSPSFFLHTPQQQPQIYQDTATGSLCVFIGSFNNLNELADIYIDTTSDIVKNGNDNHDGYQHGFTTHNDHNKINPHRHQALAAQVLLAMYIKEVSSSSSPSSSNSSPFVMLSELQGQYAFLIHDADKRQILAARDSTGTCPLYYSMTEDDDIWVASSPLYIAPPPPPPSTYRGFLSSSSSSSASSPATSPHAFSLAGGSGDASIFNTTTPRAPPPAVVVPHHLPQYEQQHLDGAIKWEEMPAGYCIFGRRPAKLMQFALSQEQLNKKELELDEEDEKVLFGRGGEGGGGDQQDLPWS